MDSYLTTDGQSYLVTGGKVYHRTILPPGIPDGAYDALDRDWGFATMHPIGQVKRYGSVALMPETPERGSVASSPLGYEDGYLEDWGEEGEV